MQVILASASPRRKELMKKLNIPFDVIVCLHEEKLNKKKSVYEQCEDISYQKALLVYNQEPDDVIVIGSDTIVVNDEKIYGKPKDYKEAFKMLKSLSNKSHEVVTSVTMLIRKNGKEYVEKFYEVANVHVDKLSKDEINEIIETSDPYSKAGGYAIQENFGKYIKKIDGDYFTIVGFPLNRVYRLLQKYM